MNTKFQKAFKGLSNKEFQQKLNEDSSAILMDVRTPEEFRSERIPNSVNANVISSSFMNKISSLDKSKTYFVYCRSGGRSAQACSIMADEGFNVYNLIGGIGSWTGEVC